MEVEQLPRATAEPHFAAELRGFGFLGILAILLILLAGNILGTALVFVWLWMSRTPARILGLVQPRSWIWTLGAGVLIGVVLKLVMKALVMPLFQASPINAAYHYLSGNTAALPGMLISVIVGAGFGEEIIWRGFLFERLRTLLGRVGKIPTVITIGAILFGLAHYADQGLAAALQAVMTGAVFGVLFAATQNIWLAVAAHAAFDVTAVFLIYWNLESALAHSIIR